MILNNWYVAAESTEITAEKPLGVRMLASDFVLFRDAAGEPHCLSAVCCHRGASLAAGRLVEGCVACPYHGWRFDAQGRCTLIPALGPEVKPPARARVDAYPVREKFGWVWVFLGDAPEEQRPPFVADDFYPEYFQPETWSFIRTVSELPVNWERAEENAIDGAHPSFVHKAFGARRSPELQLVPVQSWEWGAQTTRERVPPSRESKTGRMREITPEARGKNVATTAFQVCGICNRTDIKRADGPHQVQLAARTPIDEYSTRLFLIQARNYLREPEHDAERIAGIAQAREEDLRIVRSVKPPLQPRSPSHDLLTEADQLESAFRRKMRELTQRGWRIDSDTLERESRRRVFVIPSPARALDPHNWVHRPVPRVVPDAADAEAGNAVAAAAATAPSRAPPATAPIESRSAAEEAQGISSTLVSEPLR